MYTGSPGSLQRSHPQPWPRGCLLPWAPMRDLWSEAGFMSAPFAFQSISAAPCSRLRNGPKDTQVLIPAICECYLIDKGEFADLITLRILRRGDDPGLSQLALNIATDVLIRGGRRKLDDRREGQVMTEAETRVVSLEDGGRAANQGMQVTT